MLQSEPTTGRLASESTRTRRFLSRIHPLLFLVLLSSISVVATLASAQKSEPYSVQVDVTLVNIELEIRDNRGQIVDNLQPEDLHLLVDGVRTPWSTFEPPLSQGLMSPARDTNFEGEGQRLAIFLETAFLGSGALASVTPTLTEFVTDPSFPDRKILLAVADPQLRFDTALTADTQEVASRLSHFADKGDINRIASHYREILDSFENALGKGTPRQAPTIPDAVPSQLLNQIGNFAAEASQETDRAALRLSELVGFITGGAGRTEILYLTGRPPASAGQELFSRWQEAFGLNQQFAKELGQRDEATLGQTEDEFSSGGFSASSFGSGGVSTTDLDSGSKFRDTATRAAAANIVIHTLELSSRVGGVSLLSSQSGGQLSAGSSASGFSAQLDLDHGIRDRRPLVELSEATGGSHLRNGLDLRSQLEGAFDTACRCYKLTFAYDGSDPERAHHIEIVPEQIGHNFDLNYRRYFRSSDQHKLASTVISALHLGDTANPLEIELAVSTATSTVKGHSKVPISIRLPFSRIALNPDGHNHIGQLTLFATSGERGSVTDPVQSAVIPVRIANEELLTALARIVEFGIELELPSQSDFVAVAVRDDLSLVVSTALSDLLEESGDQSSKSPKSTELNRP